MHQSGSRIIAFPRDGNAYIESYYAAVEALGGNVVRGVWAGRWILANIHRGDVVHFHWPSFYYTSTGEPDFRGLTRFTLLLLLMRARGARIVWTAHNLYPHDGGMRSAGHRYGRRVIIALSELILVHGVQAGELVSREFSVSPRKICRIHHGHWLDYYPRDVSTEQARARLGIAPGVFVFGFVGLCKPYKNLDQLIEAFAAAGQQSCLLIAGKFQSQEYGQRIEQMLAKLDPARVIFRPGFVDDADLQVYVRASNVLVLPFTNTLTSGSAMLALSFGRPAVAPRLGGMPELIIEPCGVLYDAAQPGSLAQAMDIARGRSFDEQAILDHAAKFDWESAARPFLSALEGR